GGRGRRGGGVTPRRDVLRLGALAGAGLALAGCDRAADALSRALGADVPAGIEAPSGEVEPARHLLDRAAFGPWPGDVARVRRMGLDAWIDEQLAPASIDDAAAEVRTARIDTAGLPPRHLFAFRPSVLEEELVARTLLDAVYSRRQLEQVMVHVWSDHVHVAIGKGLCRELVTVDDREVARAHALGSFREIVRASVTSPAMLVYLDGCENKKGSPNENHARELLELHTLGVHGGYTQRDVMEAARCLTGWVVADRGLAAGTASFDPARHDDGEKVVLGVRFPAGEGARDVDRLVDVLTDHPSCARHVATRLCRAFVADEPPARAVDDAASAFTASRGAIAPVVRSILRSEAFGASARGKLKRPFRFVVSALRALGADATGRGDVARALAAMGQSPFSYPTPDGPPERGAAWLGSLLGRFDFALRLAAGRVEGARVDVDRIARAVGDRGDGLALFAHLLGRAPSGAERAAVARFRASGEARAKPHAALGVMLASPGFQWT
ncbi:MAG TPA: DUF1800 domain-containing protein, partial [Minicystis sp.]|nr:DUF1800 domain-containing protein [Minicystis sp.]